MTAWVTVLLAAWYMVLAAVIVALGYAVWTVVERRERFKKEVRGFEVKTNTDETSVQLKKEENDHG